MTSLPILFGYNVNGLGNSSVPYWLSHYWNKEGHHSPLYSPSTDRNVADIFLRPLMGSIRKKFFYRFDRQINIQKMTENYFFKKEVQSPSVYLWAGLSLDVFERFHANGNTIILERINCHQATARKHIDTAYLELGLTPPNNISYESIDIENRKLELANAVFTPSPMVYKSLLDNGVDKEKLIPASYGWSPGRFSDRNRTYSKKPTFLFVGTLCVRKGVPLLLKAWEKAGIDGQLIFCGHMDDTIKKYYGHYFYRDDVLHVPYTPDLSTYYKKADVFTFPSYEEGGPMVTYEAMAHGAVPLVSQMGAGAIVENRKNGLILDLDVNKWATAIMAIVGNKNKRLELSCAARKRALEFTWEKVAEKRAAGLRLMLPDLWH
jgi:glycosyltransferase involved in cell wall biosynthesis